MARGVNKVILVGPDGKPLPDKDLERYGDGRSSEHAIAHHA